MLSTKYLRQLPLLVYIISIHFASLANIFNFIQTKSGGDRDVIDFFDIPMDRIQESNELDKYLSQGIEKVRDPIAWLWNHQKVYPQLLAMALDYLSIPGMC